MEISTNKKRNQNISEYFKQLTLADYIDIAYFIFPFILLLFFGIFYFFHNFNKTDEIIYINGYLVRNFYDRSYFIGYFPRISTHSIKHSLFLNIETFDKNDQNINFNIDLSIQNSSNMTEVRKTISFISPNQYKAIFQTSKRRIDHSIIQLNIQSNNIGMIKDIHLILIENTNKFFNDSKNFNRSLFSTALLITFLYVFSFFSQRPKKRKYFEFSLILTSLILSLFSTFPLFFSCYDNLFIVFMRNIIENSFSIFILINFFIFSDLVIFVNNIHLFPILFISFLFYIVQLFPGIMNDSLLLFNYFSNAYFLHLFFYCFALISFIAFILLTFHHLMIAYELSIYLMKPFILLHAILCFIAIIPKFIMIILPLFAQTSFFQSISLFSYFSNVFLPIYATFALTLLHWPSSSFSKSYKKTYNYQDDEDIVTNFNEFDLARDQSIHLLDDLSDVSYS